jgi:hypothetical protein
LPGFLAAPLLGDFPDIGIHLSLMALLLIPYPFLFFLPAQEDFRGTGIADSSGGRSLMPHQIFGVLCHVLRCRFLATMIFAANLIQ